MVEGSLIRSKLLGSAAFIIQIIIIGSLKLSSYQQFSVSDTGEVQRSETLHTTFSLNQNNPVATFSLSGYNLQGHTVCIQNFDNRKHSILNLITSELFLIQQQMAFELTEQHNNLELHKHQCYFKKPC